MSQIEALAALLGVINVFLVARRSIWNFPPGIAMVVLYFFVFAEAKLYSDALLQCFFLAIQVYGWWNWVRSPRIDRGVAVQWMDATSRMKWLAATAALSGGWGVVMASLTDAAAPFADAAIAGFSIAAQLLLSLRRVENWILWIAVDIGAVSLFLSRGLTVTAGLYALFLVIATIGLFSWARRAQLRNPAMP